jgi:hypothetical protein
MRVKSTQLKQRRAGCGFTSFLPQEYFHFKGASLQQLCKTIRSRNLLSHSMNTLVDKHIVLESFVKIGRFLAIFVLKM